MSEDGDHGTAGARFRAALAAEKPLQVAGTINAYTARLAEAAGFRAIYLSGGGVAANSLGIPDLGISTMEDVLIDVRRITDACSLPLLVDIDTGWGGAFNIARTIRQMIKAGAAAVHIEDQVSAKRCGHRPGKELVPTEEMVDRIKAAVDAKVAARTDPDFVIMARTDALASEGLPRAIERAQAYVSAGADMIFAEAVSELPMYTAFRKAVGRADFGQHHRIRQDAALHARRTRPGRRRHHLVLLCRLSRHERSRAESLRDHSRRRHAEEFAAADANARRSLQISWLPCLRAEAR